MSENEIYKRFLSTLRAEIKENWQGKLTQLADKAGISQGNLSKIKNNKITARHDTQVSILSAMGISYDSLLSDDNPSTKNIMSFQSKIEKEHAELTLEFENKVVAKDFNEALVFLEKNDPETFYRLYGKAKIAAEKAKKKNEIEEVSRKAVPGGI